MRTMHFKGAMASHYNLTLYRKSDLCTLRNETALPRSQFLIHVSVSDLSVWQFGCSKICRPMLEIYKSLTYT
jgi:hypothetical protein